MAALVTSKAFVWEKVHGVHVTEPLKVADASETDLSTPDTSLVFDTRGVRRVSVHAIFANYTSVTVKAQRRLSSSADWDDITSATTSTSDDVYDFAPEAPEIRLSIAGTLSEGTDTMEVWVYMEAQPVG